MKGTKISRIYYLLLVIFLILVFSFPRILQEVKIVLLGVLLLIVVIRDKFSKEKYKLILIYSFFFPISILVAILSGNDSSYILNSFKIYFLFPMLICTIFYVDNNGYFFEAVWKSAAISLLIISVTSISTLLNGLGYLPINLNAIFYKDEDRIGLHEGYTHIINTPLTYYLFLVPLVFNKKEYFSLKRKELFCFIALIVFSILTGRRILILPFILVVLYQLRQFYKYTIPIVLISLYILNTNSFENFNIIEVYNRFISAINSSDDSYVRAEQADYFIKYIADSPIWGYGLGSYMQDYLRNEEFKTAYESSAHYLFFVLGIPLAVGLLIYYAILFFKAWIIKSDHQDIIRGIVMGSLSILIASYTNPYWMSGFDFVIPFALVLVSAAYGVENEKK